MSDPVAAVELAYQRIGELDGKPVFIHLVPREAALARARVRKIVSDGGKYSAVDAFRGQYRLAALKNKCEQVWEHAGLLMVPGAPSICTIEEVQANPVELNARLGLYTNFANLLDLAGITIPAGKRADGITVWRISPRASVH